MIRPTPIQALALAALFAAALPAQDKPAQDNKPAATKQDNDVLLQAAHIALSPDKVLAPGRILVRQGKVAYVGDEIPAEAAARALVVDYGTAWITPGFVLAQSTLGQDSDLAESAFAWTPDLLAAEAFDPWQDELKPLAGCGVTAVALSPSPRNVAGGIAALVKPGKPAARIAERELHLQLSLAAAARQPERAPTSLIGALDLVRTALTDAKAGLQGGPEIAVVRQVLDGSRQVFLHANSYTELSAALDLAKEFAFTPVIVGAADAEKVLPRLVEQKVAVVLGALSPNMRLAELQLPAMLAQAGVPFAFACDAERLRLTAVLAIKHGLDRHAAAMALSRTPAALLGQQQNLGALRAGCAADFAVWSGDPLDLASSHIATWVDGVRLAGAQPAGAR